MISLEQAKTFLQNQNLTDKEVEYVRDEIRLFAEMIFEIWQKDREKTKNLNK